jgi:hypothetical protein
LPFRNGAFEIAVVERVVFHLHRQPLVVRIERGPFCHGPGLEDAVEFQPEVIMQTAGIMFLNDKAPSLRRRYLGLA